MTENQITSVIAIVKNRRSNSNYLSAIDRLVLAQSRTYTRTRACVTRRATSIGRTNVRSSNYSPWSISHLFQFRTIGVVRKYFQVENFPNYGIMQYFKY